MSSQVLFFHPPYENVFYNAQCADEENITYDYVVILSFHYSLPNIYYVHSPAFLMFSSPSNMPGYMEDSETLTYKISHVSVTECTETTA